MFNLGPPIPSIQFLHLHLWWQQNLKNKTVQCTCRMLFVGDSKKYIYLETWKWFWSKMFIVFSECSQKFFHCIIDRSRKDLYVEHGCLRSPLLQDDIELKPGKTVGIHSLGRKRTLIVNRCTREDAGTYLCRTADDNTSAKLSVLGDYDWCCQASQSASKNQFYSDSFKTVELFSSS